MLKFLQTIRISSAVLGSAAFLALISVTPVTPAAAQGVPAGLLRLDSSQAYFAATNDDVKLTEAQQTKLRAAYARSRKNTPVH